MILAVRQRTRAPGHQERLRPHGLIGLKQAHIALESRAELGADLLERAGGAELIGVPPGCIGISLHSTATTTV